MVWIDEQKTELFAQVSLYQVTSENSACGVFITIHCSLNYAAFYTMDKKQQQNHELWQAVSGNNFRIFLVFFQFFIQSTICCG